MNFLAISVGRNLPILKFYLFELAKISKITFIDWTLLAFDVAFEKAFKMALDMSLFSETEGTGLQNEQIRTHNFSILEKIISLLAFFEGQYQLSRMKL